MFKKHLVARSHRLRRCDAAPRGGGEGERVPRERPAAEGARRAQQANRLSQQNRASKHSPQWLVASDLHMHVLVRVQYIPAFPQRSLMTVRLGDTGAFRCRPNQTEGSADNC